MHIIYDFVHLHVHSDFSFFDSTATVLALADRAEELGMNSLALTDHGNMFGIMEFLKACKETIDETGRHVPRKKPISPIIGCELYITDKYYHLVLLAANLQGYLNLMKLCSFAYTKNSRCPPRIDDELLSQYHEGLIALSACAAGEIPRLIAEGKIKEAEQRACCYRDLFGSDENEDPNFYLEINDQQIPAGALKGTALSQRQLNESIADISRKTGIPLVAANNVHYLKQEDAAAHDVLLRIGAGKKCNEENRKKFYGDQFYFKSGEEMAALFPEYPEAIANTKRIAERCIVDVPKVSVNELPRHLPDFVIPPEFSGVNAYLRHIAAEGLAKQYPAEKENGGTKWEEIQNRLQYELDYITTMEYTNYFLIVADYVNWAKYHGIPVGPGRGSAAGSIVAYVLGITNIDPLKYDLLFERFINPERISMPDFDVDFGEDGYNNVIKYVTQKYGVERVGRIITFGTLESKPVIKDVARILGISIPETDMITKLIPKGSPRQRRWHGFADTLARAFEREPKMGEKEPKHAELFALARKLEGLYRNSSLYSSGLVIAKTALYDFVPLFRKSGTENAVIQYCMDDIESCGLVRFDLFSLKTLDSIKYTENLIRKRGAEYAGFSIENISEYDEATFALFGEGKTENVFHFELKGMRNVLTRAKPKTIQDLTALYALNRPGLMECLAQFIEAKNGKEKINYPDPCLEDILRETYGIIVYQEQVMRIIQRIAGYSLGAAGILRREMGKKSLKIIARERKPFIEGAVNNGFTEKKAGEIFEILLPAAGCSFYKSHAVAYTKIAYQTAYLKANFPVEFMAAFCSVYI